MVKYKMMHIVTYSLTSAQQLHIMYFPVS